MISPISGLALEQKISTVEQLASCYGNWSGIRTNHVMTQNGQMVDEAGSSRGISSAEDRELLIALRKASEVVIVDAKTARLENYRPFSYAALVVVSSSGNFESIPAISGSNVFTASPDQDIKIDPAKPFDAILNWAAEIGFSRLLLEAGPTLTKLAFQSRSVSQSALTVTPELSAAHFAKLEHPFDDQAQLLSLAEAQGASFSFWSHQRRGS
jgi:riboflavin biosynthesis pyrimidine reductase